MRGCQMDFPETRTDSRQPDISVRSSALQCAPPPQIDLAGPARERSTLVHLGHPYWHHPKASGMWIESTLAHRLQPQRV